MAEACPRSASQQYATDRDHAFKSTPSLPTGLSTNSNLQSWQEPEIGIQYNPGLHHDNQYPWAPLVEPPQEPSSQRFPFLPISSRFTSIPGLGPDDLNVLNPPLQRAEPHNFTSSTTSVVDPRASNSAFGQPTGTLGDCSSQAFPQPSGIQDVSTEGSTRSINSCDNALGTSDVEAVSSSVPPETSSKDTGSPIYTPSSQQSSQLLVPQNVSQDAQNNTSGSSSLVILTPPSNSSTGPSRSSNRSSLLPDDASNFSRAAALHGPCSYEWKLLPIVRIPRVQKFPPLILL